MSTRAARHGLRSTHAREPGERFVAAAGASSRVTRAALGALCALALGGCWEAPPMETEQIGFRGVGMQTTSNPDLTEELVAANLLPEPLPEAPAAGPKAKDVYQNVEVLGDLSTAEFVRTMNAITAWVSPEQGCGYCHVGNNFASDDIYTKVVSRRMMQMTQNINAEWQDHVKQTGVTCYTCHRGQPVPAYYWNSDRPLNRQGGMAANSYGQNHANVEVGSTSMLNDPFSRYLVESPAPIRVVAQNALPLAAGRANLSTQDTENTYSLMVHMSTSLGQNCTYCHNSRSFTDWSQSPPTRVTAWHGLQMVPALNAAYLEPLAPVYPPELGRNGHLGDAPKVNCTTCHQNVAKPLYGQSMLDDYPVWREPGPSAATEIVDPMEPMAWPPAGNADADAAETTSSAPPPRVGDDRSAALGRAAGAAPDDADGATLLR